MEAEGNEMNRGKGRGVELEDAKRSDRVASSE